MKIGILGSGNVGTRLANLIKSAGHNVVVGNRSGSVSLADAASHGEIVIIAIHFHAVRDVLLSLSNTLSKKVLIDATNPLNDDWSPRLLGQENSAAEEIARLLPDTTVVKAFNTIFADVMTPEAQDRAGQKISAFIAGDEEMAIKKVADMARGMGFSPVTVNKLSASRYFEAMAHLNIELAVGQSGGTNAAFVYHQEL